MYVCMYIAYIYSHNKIRVQINQGFMQLIPTQSLIEFLKLNL